VNVAFGENDYSEPTGFFISNADAAWDNYYERNVQVPNTPEPSSPANTLTEFSYAIDFQRGWYIADIAKIDPVRYRNAMMDERNPERREAGDGIDNVLEMRWILQQELGGSMVFFHEVAIPPGVVEGTHQHIGSEELYLITEGEGVAYMGVNDDPELRDRLAAMGASAQPVPRHIYGVGTKMCYQVPVRKGSVIFTKSGGMHGIRNEGESDLRFVAFLYHSS
jgi:mannose-6-phosphate isomerase-like protein (cupin superfamily)